MQTIDTFTKESHESRKDKNKKDFYPDKIIVIQ